MTMVCIVGIQFVYSCNTLLLLCAYMAIQAHFLGLLCSGWRIITKFSLRHRLHRLLELLYGFSILCLKQVSFHLFCFDIWATLSAYETTTKAAFIWNKCFCWPEFQTSWDLILPKSVLFWCNLLYRVDSLDIEQLTSVKWRDCVHLNSKQISADLYAHEVVCINKLLHKLALWIRKRK